MQKASSLSRCRVTCSGATPKLLAALASAPEPPHLIKDLSCHQLSAEALLHRSVGSSWRNAAECPHRGERLLGIAPCRHFVPWDLLSSPAALRKLHRRKSPRCEALQAAHAVHAGTGRPQLMHLSAAALPFSCPLPDRIDVRVDVVAQKKLRHLAGSFLANLPRLRLATDGSDVQGGEIPTPLVRFLDGIPRAVHHGLTEPKRTCRSATKACTAESEPSQQAMCNALREP